MKILPLLVAHCTIFGAIVLIVTPAEAQLRIVDYNTTGGPRSGLETVLQAIGQEVVNGFAKPIDVLILQEQSSSATTTQAIVDVLNGLYGAGSYARATLDGGSSGAGRPGLIYNTTAIEFIDQIAFGTVSTSAQARQTLRYQLRPVGYDSSADFYVFSNHYKAGTSSSDEDRRDVEASALRANLDALDEGTHAILAGDFNIQSSGEAMYQTLLSAGPGQAFDPASRPGNWHDGGSFRDVHTQAPAVNPPGGLIGGGIVRRRSSGRDSGLSHQASSIRKWPKLYGASATPVKVRVPDGVCSRILRQFNCKAFQHVAGTDGSRGRGRISPIAIAKSCSLGVSPSVAWQRASGQAVRSK